MAMPDARTIAALKAGGEASRDGGSGARAGARAGAAQGVGAAAAGGAVAAGSAIRATNLPSGPAVRGVRESIGDQVVGGSGVGGGGAGGALRPGYAPDGRRMGRNDVCFCGSGLKYKKCHGR
jgi:preprotein translocase subunit SecA